MGKLRRALTGTMTRREERITFRIMLSAIVLMLGAMWLVALIDTLTWLGVLGG